MLGAWVENEIIKVQHGVLEDDLYDLQVWMHIIWKAYHYSGRFFLYQLNHHDIPKATDVCNIIVIFITRFFFGFPLVFKGKGKLCLLDTLLTFKSRFTEFVTYSLGFPLFVNHRSLLHHLWTPLTILLVAFPTTGFCDYPSLLPNKRSVSFLLTTLKPPKHRPFCKLKIFEELIGSPSPGWITPGVPFSARHIREWISVDVNPWKQYIPENRSEK